MSTNVFNMGKMCINLHEKEACVYGQRFMLLSVLIDSIQKKYPLSKQNREYRTCRSDYNYLHFSNGYYHCGLFVPIRAVFFHH